ncbi:MAG: hypothetical protein MJ181_04125 [Treponema sp.]|nr:hypothetical protein [Treponema sp.]
MKKVLCLLLLCFSVQVLSFAQNVSYAAAARRTAERCLKLSETYFLSRDYTSAFNQAEMGLNYDDSVSDLYYLKAVSRKKLGATVKEVISLAKTASEKGNWIGYNEKGNRVLLADLLSDTGSYSEALDELDRTPFVFSADAEVIRIKTYYREGSDDSISKAREKINSARRIYKGDQRFLNLFYTFELGSVLEGGKDYVPSVKALQIADVLSQEMKNYKDISVETESASIFFMSFSDPEKAVRSLKAFDAAGKSDPLFAVTALRTGLWDEAKAFDEFFRFADKSVTVELLGYFAEHLTDTLDNFYEHLNAYEGLLYVDCDKDLQWELTVQYERGRPQYIHFDSEYDGVEDLSAVLDFGELLSVNILPLETELFYSEYPYLGRAVLHRDNEYVVFDFAKEAAIFSAIDFEEPFENLLGKRDSSFYVPAVKNTWNDVSSLDYLANATFIKLDCSERENATVTYSLLDGNIVSAVYSANDTIYASADFINSLPVSRVADYDNDGLLETCENFTEYPEGKREYFSEEDFLSVDNLFPFFRFSESVYLSSVQIDSNNDNIPEYREYFREKGGKTSVWIKSDGRTETFTRFPRNDGDPLVEESVFVIGLEQKTVSVLFRDAVPSSVKINEDMYRVIPGELEDLYWIDENLPYGGSGKVEVQVAAKMAGLENGFVVPFEIEGEGFFRAIKMADTIFIRKTILSLTEKDLEKEDVMTKEEFSLNE